VPLHYVFCPAAAFSQDLAPRTALSPNLKPSLIWLIVKHSVNSTGSTGARLVGNFAGSMSLKGFQKAAVRVCASTEQNAEPHVSEIHTNFCLS